jgi:hypothetical protein
VVGRHDLAAGVDDHPRRRARYVGRADDVVGEAQGEAAGNALRWRYVLALPVDGRVWNVDFDDWMFLIDDKVMLNRSACASSASISAK